MKEIKAYIRNVMVDDVLDALSNLENIGGIAVVPLDEYAHSREEQALERIPMTKIELDVVDNAEQPVVDCILRYGRTGEGHPGDGRVFVTRLERSIRISTGEEENNAD